MSHFKYDKALVRKATRRDPERELQDARQDGFYSYTEFKLVPIKDIAPETVWNPPRIERIREALASKTPLPPIHGHFDQARRFHISDGIHRYNASLEKGFTHVPALASVHVDAPEAQEPELPERPKLDVGDAVLLRDPRRPGPSSNKSSTPAPHVVEASDDTTRRHPQQRGRPSIGDFRDDQLDVPSKPMPTKLRALFQAY